MCRLEIFTCVILTAFLCAYFQHIGAYFMFIIITAEWVWVWVRILFFSRFCIFMIFFMYVEHFHEATGNWTATVAAVCLSHIANYMETENTHMTLCKHNIRGIYFLIILIIMPHTHTQNTRYSRLHISYYYLKRLEQPYYLRQCGESHTVEWKNPQAFGKAK